MDRVVLECPGLEPNLPVDLALFLLLLGSLDDRLLGLAMESARLWNPKVITLAAQRGLVTRDEVPYLTGDGHAMVERMLAQVRP